MRRGRDGRDRAVGAGRVGEDIAEDERVVEDVSIDVDMWFLGSLLSCFEASVFSAVAGAFFSVILTLIMSVTAGVLVTFPVG